MYSQKYIAEGPETEKENHLKNKKKEKLTLNNLVE